MERRIRYDGLAGLPRVRRSSLALLGAIFLSFVGLGACTSTEDPLPALDPATYAATLESGVNDARTAEGLPELTHSDCAVDAAAARAADLVGNPDLPHAPMDAVLAECGVGVAGENLSRATLPADAVVEAWLGSPGHRSNILDTQYTASGVACVPDGEALVCSHVFLGD